MRFNGAENTGRLAGRQATLSGRGTVGVKLLPASDRCYREREGVRDKGEGREGGDRGRGESFAACRMRDH